MKKARMKKFGKSQATSSRLPTGGIN